MTISPKMSLNYFLDTIDQSANSIKTLAFKRPGIFTNAILSNPEITTLIRDAHYQEQSLYRVVNDKYKSWDIAVERIDIQNQNQNNNQTNTNVLFPGDYVYNKDDESIIKRAVEVPQINNGQGIEKPSNLEGLLNEIDNEQQKDAAVIAAASNNNDMDVDMDIDMDVDDNEKYLEDQNKKKEYGVDVLCEAVERLTRQYPIDGIDEKIQYLRNKWIELNEDIMQYEEIVETQRQQLETLRNDDYNFSRYQNNISIEDQILKEEETIMRLEKELEFRNQNI